MNDIDYAAVLADLERRKADIEQAISTIRRLQGQPSDVEGGAAPTAPLTGMATKALRDDAFFGMNTPEAIKAFLEFARRPQTAAKIADELVAHGFQTTSAQPANTIRTTLRRMEEAGDVAKVKKEWGLASWYPGLRSKRAAGGKANGDEDGGDGDE